MKKGSIFFIIFIFWVIIAYFIGAYIANYIGLIVVPMHIVLSIFGAILIYEQMNSKIFEVPKNERLADDDGWTVAHQMAARGHEFTDPEIFKLANKDGQSVAHAMAARGYEFTGPEVLQLTNDLGRTVADICDKKHKTDRFNKILQEAEEQDSPGMG